jgi:hypothetical protein
MFDFAALPLGVQNSVLDLAVRDASAEHAARLRLTCPAWASAVPGRWTGRLLFYWRDDRDDLPRDWSAWSAVSSMYVQRIRPCEIEGIGGMTGLRHLRLECDPLSYAELASLSTLSRLQELDLTCCILESTNMEPLRNLTSLTCLTLFDIDIWTASHQHHEWEYVQSLEPLCDLTSLTELNLRPSIVRHQSEIAVLSALTGLRTLRLDGEQTSDRGMRSDALWFLKHLTGLTALGLEDSGDLDDTALPHLLPLTSLTALDMHYSPGPTPDGMADLVQQLPLLTRFTGVEEIEEALKPIIHPRGGQVGRECGDGATIDPLSDYPKNKYPGMTRAWPEGMNKGD